VGIVVRNLIAIEIRIEGSRGKDKLFVKKEVYSE
jgi:hypothetical protein